MQTQSTPNQTQIPTNIRWIAKLSGIVIVLSLIFLPIASCGEMTFTGLDVFSDGNIGAGIKILLGVSILFALVSLFLNKGQSLIWSGVIGLVSLAIGYMKARHDVRVLSLDIGAYIAGIGFVVLAFIGSIMHMRNNDEKTAK